MRMSVATLPTLPRANRTIGAILMDAGLLSADDAEQIVRLQRQNLAHQRQERGGVVR